MGTEDSDAQNPRAVQKRNFGTFRMVTKDGFLEETHSAESERVTRADQVKEKTGVPGSEDHVSDSPKLNSSVLLPCMQALICCSNELGHP